MVEILSPGDETWEKLQFYDAHDVEELLLVDPEQRTVSWLVVPFAGGYVEAERSTLLGLSAGELAEQLEWPRS